MIPDLTSSDWTDELLDELRKTVLNEQERRENLARIPAQVEQLANTFKAGGGDPVKLTEAIS